jgi:hypothetical protein
VIAKIELFQDGVAIQTVQPDRRRYDWDLKLTPGPGKHHYFVKVTQKDGNCMWSAPVWVTVPGATAATTPDGHEKGK